MQEIKNKFIRDRKGKAFYKVIKRWLIGEEIEEMEVAVNLSSMLTHSLIEIKENNIKSKSVGLVLAQELEISFQSQSIKDLIYGDCPLSEVRKGYLERFGESFGIEGE